MQDLKSKWKIVVLCGGRGASRFAGALAQRFSHVTFLVNAYDDGRSTGRIRAYLGVLGPSDIAKNLTTLVAAAHGADAHITAFLRLRLPAAVPIQDLELLLASLIWEKRFTERIARYELARTFSMHVSQLPVHIGQPVREYLHGFVDRLKFAEKRWKVAFDLRDMAVRNAVLVGAYYAHGEQYNRAASALQRILGIESDVVVSSERQGFLVATLSNGTVLHCESDIAESPRAAPIHRIHIVNSAPTRDEVRGVVPSGDAGAVSSYIESKWGSCRIPSEVAVKHLRECDALIYAPGTHYSSTIPTLIDVGQIIRELHVPKILIANLVQEQDQLDVADIVTNVCRYGEGFGTSESSGALTEQMVSRYVTHVVVDADRHEIFSTTPGDYLPINRERLRSIAQIVEHNVEDKGLPGFHAPEPLVDTLTDIIARYYSQR